MYLKGFKALVCPFLKVGEVFLEIGNFPTTRSNYFKYSGQGNLTGSWGMETLS